MTKSFSFCSSFSFDALLSIPVPASFALLVVDCGQWIRKESAAATAEAIVQSVWMILCLRLPFVSLPRKMPLPPVASSNGAEHCRRIETMGDLWKQVCSNSYPIMFANFGNEEKDEMDYRRLTLGLWRGREYKDKTLTYIPRLRPEQIFCVVDLYRKIQVSNGKRRKDMTGSWVCPLSFFPFSCLLRHGRQ